MSLLSQYEDEDGTLQSKTANSLTAAPSPPILQWVSVGEGGKVSSVSKVRSHVSREYHQRRRDGKRANQERLSHQQNMQLLPGALLDRSTRSTFSNSPTSEKGGSTATENALEGPLARQKSNPSQSPSTAVKYQANCKRSHLNLPFQFPKQSWSRSGTLHYTKFSISNDTICMV